METYFWSITVNIKPYLKHWNVTIKRLQTKIKGHHTDQRMPLFTNNKHGPIYRIFFWFTNAGKDSNTRHLFLQYILYWDTIAIITASGDSFFTFLHWRSLTEIAIKIFISATDLVWKLWICNSRYRAIFKALESYCQKTAGKNLGALHWL